VARRYHQAERLVVGGLDRMGGGAGRRTRQAACHGKQPVPGDRGRARPLRTWLTEASPRAPLD
jgi:hypothetical protein